MLSHFTRYNESPNSLYHLFLALPSLWEAYFALKGFTILCLMDNRDFDNNEDLKGNDLLALISPGRVQLIANSLAVYLRSISKQYLEMGYFLGTLALAVPL